MQTFTEEQRKLSAKNRNALRKKLGIRGNANLVLHHVDTTLRYTDVERYIEWREEDVVVMERGEHTKLHAPLFMDDEYRQNMSKIKKGCVPGNKGMHYKIKDTTNFQGPKPWMRGKHWKLSEETKKNMSESAKKYYSTHPGNSVGKHWYNNGEKETYATECPEGYVKGRLPDLMKAINSRKRKHG